VTELIARIDARADMPTHVAWLDVIRSLGVDPDNVLSVFEVVRVDRGNWDVTELRLRECVLTEDGHKQVHPDDPHEIWTKPLDVLVPDGVKLPTA
jgi:hypothetical protein